MNFSTSKRREKESNRQSAANAIAQRHSHGAAAFQFGDNDHLAIANSSRQVRQLQHFQQLADNMIQTQAGQTMGAGEPSHGAVVQRIVDLGGTIYKPRKRNHGIQNLIDLVNNTNNGNIELRYDWKARIKEYMNEPGVAPRAFTDIHDLIDYLKKSPKKTQSQKNQEQDQRIQGLNTGYGNTEMEYAKILSYESEKAFDNFTGQVMDIQEYDDTKMDLEGLAPDVRSTTNDFTQTNNPFINMLALGNSDLSRLDFMGPGGVEIDTLGYSSRGDRSVDPGTLSDNFSLGTVRIGPDISSYKREMQTNTMPDQNQLSYLNPLEMMRLPQQSVQTGMKRQLYNQGQFSKDQGMGYNHNHSSVEFVGAVHGSGLNQQQVTNMRRQQTLSNYAILETANNICPNTGIGQVLSNGKPIATPKEEMDALMHFIQVVQDLNSTQQDKDQAKRELRRILVRILRGVTQIEEIESDDENNYPTSPYDPNSYV
ncbi:hypothetical protein C900_00442 [Fulvivirga imtechensis AK7]|uniref:Uncharacterized protein n=1 Tax=Fulvivirga imtechensis AK7 TaxID=1237149 RepID=L8JHW5_9BACT|nr:hypothetical protein [Fulvivirga imtechensis]ELR68410.1 hypothetical protein C900_00442 [Fulvivirga imtechensis AK7]